MMTAHASFPRVVITGASGWIGTAMLAHLAARLGEGWKERVTLFGSSARTLQTAMGPLAVKPLQDIGGADVHDAIIVHLAYLTKEKAEQEGARAFAQTNRAIDDHVLRAINEAAPRSVFVASSGAAALAADGRDCHPYGVAKIEQEKRFLAISRSLALPVLVGRVFNLAGPHINKIDSYAIGAFVMQALSTGTIQIDATVPVFRSFLHVDDLCALVITAAHSALGQASPIDLCGTEVLEMGDIAARVARSIGGSITIKRATVDVTCPSIYLGSAVDTKVLAMSLGLDLRSFDQQVADTISYVSTVRYRVSGADAAKVNPPSARLGAVSPEYGADSAKPVSWVTNTNMPSFNENGNIISEMRR